MAQLDDKILRCLFSERFMNFRTCINLRSVSARFDWFAAKYCVSHKELDLSDLTKAYNGHNEMCSRHERGVQPEGRKFAAPVTRPA